MIGFVPVKHGNASDVIHEGLRALQREERAMSIKEFQKIMADLPEDPITSEIENEIGQSIKHCARCPSASELSLRHRYSPKLGVAERHPKIHKKSVDTRSGRT